MGGQDESCEHGSYQCHRCFPNVFGKKPSTLPQPKPYQSSVVAIDLDGTLAEGVYPSPEIGAPIMKMVEAAIEYRRLGHEVAIYTSRPDDHRDRIMRWLRQNGLEDVIYTVVTGKLKYALLIDDRAVAFPEAFEKHECCSDYVNEKIAERQPRRMVNVAMHWKDHEENVENGGCRAFGCVPV